MVMTRLEYIDSKIGTPYEINGRGPDSFDCFGLVVDYFREVIGKDLEIEFEEMHEGWHREEAYNEYKKQLLRDNGEWLEKPEEDCIVLMGMTSPNLIDHIGIYIGEDKVLNISGQHGVVVNRLSALTRFKKVRGYINAK